MEIARVKKKQNKLKKEAEIRRISLISSSTFFYPCSVDKCLVLPFQIIIQISRYR